MKKVITFIAQGFGLGYSPVAPGTVGSLLGCLLVWGLTILNFNIYVNIAICVALTLICIPICSVAEKYIGKTDPGGVVADEYLLFPICMLGLYDKWLEHWWLMPMCFVVARVMDIAKPYPAYQLQKLHGGLGITIDDFIASIYALGINWLLYSLIV